MQEYALQVLMLLDLKERNERFLDSFKMALISHDPARFVKVLYPQWSEGEAAEEDDLGLDSHEGGEWHFAHPMDPEEAEEVMRMMESEVQAAMDADEVDNAMYEWG